MGRHSAPGDDEDPAPGDASSVATVSRGRHTRDDGPRPRPAPEPPDAGEDGGGGLALLEQALGAPPDPLPPVPAAEDATVEIPLVDLARDDRPVPEEVTAKIAPVTDGAPGASPVDETPAVRGAHATRHDLSLVMSHGDVRARVLAAVLVPFVVYVAVLAIIGALTVHSLIWVWIPAIVAGMLVGLVLDAGHRRYPAGPSGDSG